ncbi:tyrosine-type recombinase/integrase [Alkalihalobacillus deserti]|uniref:tyrosine-type recombinase/integrase n=1 Tax=Alkalihalobacillus deserti TaxID=2879466 RepID=UPI001D1570D5|nr:tyrosine-type recombinase/integrase [Alkalihalobacillus deserti]
MQTQDSIQLSLFDFNFEGSDQGNDKECIIEELFTENDMIRFGKGRKGWNENGISRNKSSDLRIENPVFGNDVNKENLFHIESWIDDMIEKMYDLDLRMDGDFVGSENVNEWLFTNIVKVQLNSRYIKKFMKAKLDVSIRVYSINIDMFEKVLPVIERLTKKKANDFERGDFLNTEYLRDVLKPLNSLELQYYQSFLNSLKPFTKVCVKNYVDKKEKTKFDHPLVRVAESVLRKERNIKPQSFNNNYYVPIRYFVSWATSSLVKFQNQSINTFIFNMVTSENLDDYKSFLIKQVKEDELTELTAMRNLQYVRGFFQLLFRKKKIVKDVTTYLTNIKADDYFYRRLPTDEEIQEFVNVIDKYSSNPTGDKLALSLMILLGFRGCEVASLSWEDINFSTRSISITDTKGMDAILPIPSKVYELLILYKKSAGNNKYIFCDKPKSFTAELRRLFNTYQFIAGWDYGGGLHLFRHIYVTRLIMHCPPQIVKSLTRHISDDTVAKYVHLERKFVKNELKKLSYSGR